VNYDALLLDWEAYSATRDGTFPQWCADRGRTYRWPRIYYYGLAAADDRRGRG
jgi:hypothetical protein